MGANMYPNFLRIAVDWFKGDYASGQFYNVNDVVIYNSNAYVCINTCNNIPPTNTAYWTAFSTSGSGDMTKSVYDTNNNGVVDKAEKLNTARSISVTGVVSGNGAFDGSANITITTTGNVSGMSDVDATAKADGKMITWNATSGKHVYTTPPTGGSAVTFANIKNYGAVGNYDDITIPLQNCLNANNFAYIPNGNYMLGAITVPAGATIRGEGTAVNITPISTFTSGQVMFKIAGGGVLIEDIKFYGANQNFTVFADDNPSDTVWRERYYFRNIQCFNVAGDFMRFTARGLDYIFENLWVDKVRGYGLYCRNISDSNMTNCSFSEGWKSHVDIDGGNFRFVQCKFMLCGNNTPYPAVNLANTLGFVFSGCEFQQNQYDALRITNVSGVIISGCNFDSNNQAGLTGNYASIALYNCQFVQVNALLMDGRFESVTPPYNTTGLNGVYQDDRCCYNYFNITYNPTGHTSGVKATHVEPFVTAVNDISSVFLLNNRDYFNYPSTPLVVGNNLTLGTGGNNSQSANFTITPTASSGGNVITLTQGTTKTLAASGEFYNNKAVVNLSSLVGTANDPTGKSYIYVMYDNKVINTTFGAFNAYIDITETSTANPTGITTGQVRVINVNKNSKWMPMAVYKPLSYSNQAGFSIQLNLKMGCSAAVSLNANDVAAMFRNIRIGFI